MSNLKLLQIYFVVSSSVAVSAGEVAAGNPQVGMILSQRHLAAVFDGKTAASERAIKVVRLSKIDTDRTYGRRNPFWRNVAGGGAPGTGLGAGNSYLGGGSGRDIFISSMAGLGGGVLRGFAGVVAVNHAFWVGALTGGAAGLATSFSLRSPGPMWQSPR